MTNRRLQLAALITVGAAVFSATGCNKLKARDQLNKGVASYKNARYEQAIDHFQNAVSLDPSLGVARLYLATAYTQLYIPEVDTPDNVRMAEQAIEQYKTVLQHDPKSVPSVKGIAYLYLQQKKFDEASEYYRKAIAIDPNDPEAYYTLGVIAWTRSYKPRMEARAKLGLKPDEPLKDKKVCQTLHDANWDIIQGGLDDLKKALDLRPDYDDAMAYTNLLYREKADLECGDPAARAADEKTADEWVDKTMATKKAKAEKQPTTPGASTQ
ncbi:MAG: tetratricopeptide repeat protein [Terriglobales bacterium]